MFLLINHGVWSSKEPLLRGAVEIGRVLEKLSDIWSSTASPMDLFILKHLSMKSVKERLRRLYLFVRKDSNITRSMVLYGSSTCDCMRRVAAPWRLNTKTLKTYSDWCSLTSIGSLVGRLTLKQLRPTSASMKKMQLLTIWCIQFSLVQITLSGRSGL